MRKINAITRQNPTDLGNLGSLHRFPGIARKENDMKKYIVVKELPGLPIGETFEHIAYPSFAYMAEKGWIKEVKEPETLINKLMNSRTFLTPMSAEKIIEITQAHFKANPQEIGCVKLEDVLRVYDEICDSDMIKPYLCPSEKIGIRSALEKLLKGHHE